MKKILSEVSGFEDCSEYIIYDNGQIFSLNTNDFLKFSTDSKGYLYMDLRHKKSILKCPKVHRLVMMAFSEEVEKEQINHIDFNKKNNSISNLEYVTNKENRQHALAMRNSNEMDYEIEQYDLDGNFIRIFDTARSALNFLGKNHLNSGNIGRCVNGKRKTAYGYIWRQHKSSTTRTRVRTSQVNGDGNEKLPNR